ncbi:MAG: hypothetical protein KGI50_06240 [Patescibacteria group bacterium]|nr:hypothetical protein [Patescibacteria group bacterium]
MDLEILKEQRGIVELTRMKLVDVFQHKPQISELFAKAKCIQRGTVQLDLPIPGEKVASRISCPAIDSDGYFAFNSYLNKNQNSVFLSLIRRKGRLIQIVPVTIFEPKAPDQAPGLMNLAYQICLTDIDDVAMVAKETDSAIEDVVRITDSLMIAPFEKEAWSLFKSSFSKSTKECLSLLAQKMSGFIFESLLIIDSINNDNLVGAQNV